MATKDVHSLSVIGVGTSAGGLEALRMFLSSVAPPVPAAIVVVQHLDPTQDSMLAEILNRTTDFTVVEAEDAVKLEAGVVYAIPPGKAIALRDGALVLSPISSGSHRRTPVDYLFRSLADSYGPAAVGVILSGSGTDGTQGVRDIKNAGGLVVIEDPDLAEFDGMPRSAQDTGLVDYHAPADALLPQILALLKEADDLSFSAEAPDKAAYAPVIEHLSKASGYDFSDYKSGTLARRIRRRMGLTASSSIADYLKLLGSSQTERTLLTKDLLIGVTRFFRDPEAWEELDRRVIEKLVTETEDGGTIRTWVAGCATGEEAYTLAILFLERIEDSGKAIDLQVFATDLNLSAIETARSGVYPNSAIADLSATRRTRWFEAEDDLVRVKSAVREKLVFAAQNAVYDPPFSRLDLITCRNLLIYLEAGAQNRLIDTFHFALREGGHLMLGKSESADRARNRFEAVAQKFRIYRRKPGPSTPGRLGSPGKVQAKPVPTPVADLPARDAVQPSVFTRLMLARFAPPTLLLDEKGNFLSFHGEIDRFLDFRRGVMSGNISSTLKEVYKSRVFSAFRNARKSGELTTASLNDAETGTSVKVTVEPVKGAAGGRSFLVYFEDLSGVQIKRAEPSPRPSQDDADLLSAYETEIEELREELQSVLDQGESYTEELQAANEEVMSANEELQSSNEELETSREELQSLNEELTTVNSELQEKVSLLEAANDDLSNLINSTEVATIFLGTDLCIRRFSAKASDVLSVRPFDVGRPLEDLTLKVDDPRLLSDAREVIRTLESREAEISGSDLHYLRRVTPYRTRQDRIAGAIVTYADVTRLRQAVQRYEQQFKRQSFIAELGEVALSSEDRPALLRRATRALAELTDADMSEVLTRSEDGRSLTLSAGEGFARGLSGTVVVPYRLDGLYHHAMRSLDVTASNDLSEELRFKTPQHLADHDVGAGMAIQIGPPNHPWGVLGAYRRSDRAFTEDEKGFLKSVAGVLWLAVSQAEVRRLREEERRSLQALIDGIQTLIGVTDTEGRLTLINRSFEKLGLTQEESGDLTLAAAFGDEVADQLGPVVARTLEGESAEHEVRLVMPDGETRTHLMYFAPRLTRDERVDGAYLTAIDIQDRKQTEERNRIISAELDHRVKNILALVNSISRMTARNSETLEQFRTEFSNRINSLSRTHSALSEGNWNGMDLRVAIESELAVYGATQSPKCDVGGPGFLVSAKGAQSLSLVFHELTTNAVKYGALAGKAGRLVIDWTRDGGNLVIRWEERGLKNIAEPKASGFGSKLIENAIGHQLRGKLERTFRTDGVRYEFRIPLDRLEAEAVR